VGTSIHEQIVKFILPSGITEYFDIKSVQAISTNKLVIELDEKNIIPEGLNKDQVESKGFLRACELEDFPVRDKQLSLKIRRRIWRDKKTGETFTRDWDLTVNGTKYSKEFGAFLKALDRYTSGKY
jgi:hypothetical protein